MQFSKTPMVNIIVFFSIFLLLGGIAYLSYSSEKKESINEPYLFAYEKGSGLFFNIDKDLYHAQEDGTFIKKKSLAEMGIDSFVSEIAIHKHWLYVLQAKKKNILKCDLSFINCEVFTTLKSHITLNPLQSVDSLSFSFSPDNKHFYVANSPAHSIDYYDISGKFLYTLNTGLQYPNDILVLEDEIILIADTNNHRIHAIQNISQDKTDPLWDIDLSSYEYSWPTDIVLDKHLNLWVIATDGFFDFGNVELFTKDERGEYSHSQSYPYLKNKKPRALAKLENSIVISEASEYKIYESDLSANTYKYFGDSNIQALFNEKEDEINHWNNQVFLSQGFIALSIILLILAAFIEYINTDNKKALFTQTKEEEPTRSKLTVEEIIQPDKNGIIWLKADSKRIQMLKRVMYGLIFISLCLFALILFIFNSLDVKILSLLGGLITFTLVIAYLALRGFYNMRLGVSKDCLYIVNAFNKMAKDGIENITYTKRRIIIKGLAISLKDGHGNTLFNQSQFDAYILPVLSRTIQISDVAYSLEALKKGDLKTWLGIFLLAGVFVIIYWFELY